MVTVTGGQTDTNAKTGTSSYLATAVIADANYTLKNATCTFTIAQKSVKDAVVKLAPGDMLHTGAEVTQSVDSVTVDGMTLSASDYEIAQQYIDSNRFRCLYDYFKRYWKLYGFSFREMETERRGYADGRDYYCRK